jgi:lipase chaperone LimK
LPASQREAEIQRLRSQRFNNTEQLRLAAYEEGDK